MYIDRLSIIIHIHLTFTRESFEKIYRFEQAAKTKERTLLVLNVVYQNKVSARVARDLHRCKSWACEWLRRYEKKVENYLGLVQLSNSIIIYRKIILGGALICIINHVFIMSQLYQQFIS